MKRFQASKYRNAAPKIPKKEEYISGIRVGDLKSCFGNHIKASDKFMTFNVESGDFVTDMDFSPFDGRILATGSYDCSIKLWKIPDEGINQELSSTLCKLPSQSGRVENVLFHPSASEVLGSSCGTSLTVWDLQKQQSKYNLDSHGDLVQSFCWKGDGSLSATSSKDKKIRILDPRCSSIVGQCDGFSGLIDSRILWLGTTDRILGSVWDVHDLAKPIQTLRFDTSSGGILMPFFDRDTNMLFLAGKGDSFIHYLEASSSAASFLTQNSTQIFDEQHKGMAIVPKLAMDVMSGEVVRLLQLTKSTVVPLSYCVPRRMKKVSLNPMNSKTQTKQQPPKVMPQKSDVTKEKPDLQAQTASASKDKTDSQSISASDSTIESPAKPIKAFTGVRASKFRHLHGTPMHKSKNIENVHNLSISLPGDSDGFQVNRDFVAYPLSGPGGQIAVVSLTNPCRLPDAGMPTIQCGSSIMDFTMDPLNKQKIAVACENGFVSVWEIPDGGLTENIDTPSVLLKGHQDKPNVVRYHPTASGVLASAALDLTVKIWDINSAKALITLADRPWTCRKPWSSCCLGMSTRIISVYDSRNLSETLSTLEINIAPSVLIPFYDEDSAVLFLSSKAVGFLPKTVCDIKKVEFARAVKLNKTSIDLITFQVPRVKMEYFQDDLFPPSRAWWEPALTSSQWFAGENGQQKKLFLKPADMKPLSEAPKREPIARKYDSRHELDDAKTTDEQKEELISSMVEKLRSYDEEPLPQDLQEGVDDDEWDD
ncbi:Coronin-7 [Acropora cervicornis]|uniref:Coronin n=1 Tax=Acropora cervicornis TaxID=6130 RepID=A0AAD9V744_ACRCE|nr:Coronin-7 [Acropora cervicornis]